MKVKKYIKEYSTITDQFLRKELDVDIFISKIIYLSQNCPPGLSDDQFWITESFNHLVHKYDPNENLRKKVPDLLSKDQLRKKVETLNRELNKLLGKHEF